MNTKPFIYNQPPFNILALSGGGMRGLFTARVLEQLEKQANRPIAECFDLICGTSIGGIIALGLGIKKPAKIIADTIEDHGKEIFHRRIFRRGWGSAKYSNHTLSKIADKLFEDKTINDSRCRLLITSVNYSTGKPQFFKTRHHENFVSDYKLKMADVAMSTSAAPTYFPIWKRKGDNRAYIDGGVVANAPGLLGVHEAKHFLGIKGTINLLAIGTMSADARIGGEGELDRGTFYWRRRLFDIVISAQENLTDYMLEHTLNENSKYVYLNATPDGNESKNIALDKTNDKAINVLKSHASDISQKFLGSKDVEIFLEHCPPIFHPIPIPIKKNMEVSNEEKI